MSLQLKHYSQPTRTENSLAYHFSSPVRDYYLNLFFPWIARSWNMLPEYVVQLESVEAFKRLIDVVMVILISTTMFMVLSS